jgi:predicted dehydrogenase
MADRLRWGILGVAKINNRLIPAFKKIRNGDLCAIASRSVEKATEAAKSAGIPVAYGSYEELLADPKIDAVYIPLPNHLHDEWTRRAADHGKHVLCEKPLTPSAASALALAEYCAHRKVRLMDGFMWPHHPRTRHIQEMLRNGIIGDVRLVKGAFTFLLEQDPANIRLQSASAGGSLLDVGCYPVYGIRWAFGKEPMSVYAVAQFQNAVDLSMNGVLKFDDGSVAEFDCGFTLPFRGWLEIVGTKGVIRVPEMWLPGPRAEYFVQIGETPFREESLPGFDQIQLMLENFGAAVLDSSLPTPQSAEAVKTLQVLDALAQSARSGREVAVLQN